MADAKRDGNFVTTLIGVSSLNFSTPTLIAVNPSTGAMLIDGPSLYATLDLRYALIGSGGTPGGSDTQIQFNDTGSFNGNAGLTFDKTNIIETITHNAIGTTSSDGIVLKNTTAAALGSQQISPRLHFQGQGWKTTGSVSQTLDVITELIPVQAAVGQVPVPKLDYSYQIAGGGYLPLLTLKGDQAGAGILVGFGTNTPNSTAHFVAPINPQLRLQSTATGNHELRITADDSNSVLSIASNASGGTPFPIAISFSGGKLFTLTKDGFCAIGDDFMPTGALQVALAGTGGIVKFQVDNTGNTGIINGGNLGIGQSGSSMGADVMVGLASTTQGLALPLMADADRDAIGASTATLLIANSDTNLINMYDAARGFWVELGGYSQPRILSISSDYTFLPTDDIALVDTSGTSITVTLPSGGGHGGGSAAIIGKLYTVKQTDGGFNSITLDGNGAMVDGSSSISTTLPYDKITVVYDGTNWFSI